LEGFANLNLTTSQGPLVSELIPSNALTQEYANADSAYQAKTAVRTDIIVPHLRPAPNLYKRCSRAMC
jgi:hypothetical protein